ncbi:MAG: diguanylate cyclase [Deinococcales bacterium]
MIVDDHPTNLRLLFDALHGEGYEVLVAQSGKSMLSRLEHMNPDIILLDVKMPDMDGFEVCQKLKRDYASHYHTPVIFMTALSDTESKVQAFEIGAVDYVTKPVQVVEVIARVKTHLKIHSLQQELSKRVQELEESHTKIERMSIEDALTSLYNRRYLDDYLFKLYEQSKRYKKVLTLAMLDIDHFKQINDNFSHKVGDDVLRQVAKLFQETIRAADMVARYGGEEFVIVFPETSLDEAKDVSERVRRTISSYPWGNLQQKLQVTISIGLASGTELESYEKLLSLADDKLYESKRAGRNRVSS